MDKFGNTIADKELAKMRNMESGQTSANEDAEKLRNMSLPDYENTPADCLGSVDKEYQEYKKSIGK